MIIRRIQVRSMAKCSEDGEGNSPIPIPRFLFYPRAGPSQLLLRGGERPIRFGWILVLCL